ncbi:unnamed protein product [Adineta steineri]|uniref:Uncharacterized protein n=1 Tax=Adineta steineri TaxID=433720 RepID=A0A813N3N3_9BILA|nr:unnamed protein product [Adineta steineri]
MSQSFIRTRQCKELEESVNQYKEKVKKIKDTAKTILESIESTSGIELFRSSCKATGTLGLTTVGVLPTGCVGLIFTPALIPISAAVGTSFLGMMGSAITMGVTDLVTGASGKIDRWMNELYDIKYQWSAANNTLLKEMCKIQDVMNQSRRELDGSSLTEDQKENFSLITVFAVLDSGRTIISELPKFKDLPDSGNFIKAVKFVSSFIFGAAAILEVATKLCDPLMVDKDVRSYATALVTKMNEELDRCQECINYIERLDHEIRLRQLEDKCLNSNSNLW